MRWRIWRRTFGHEGRRLRSLHPSSTGTFPIRLRVTDALAITHVVLSSVQHHCPAKDDKHEAIPYHGKAGRKSLSPQSRAGQLLDRIQSPGRTTRRYAIHNGTISHSMRMRSQIWICCSFVDRNGHNLIEAAYGTCVLLIEQLVFGHLHPMDS